MPNPNSELDPQKQITAWNVYGDSDYKIRPGALTRDWMDRTHDRYAYRCLPLSIANQHGWTIHCPTAFTAEWNGTPNFDGVTVKFDDVKNERICSHFGNGVLTFYLPWLFQTPTDINLWVKGPPNMFRDGIQPLEGIVESDWLENSFTMNWMLTRPNHEVRFEAGDAICMLVPVQRHLAESLQPQIRPLAADPERQRRFEEWKVARDSFNQRLANGDEETIKQAWQKDYMLGLNSDGKATASHQTRLSLRQFRQCDE